MGGWINDERGYPIHTTNFRHLGDLAPENENWWREFGKALERAHRAWGSKSPPRRYPR
jgi:hypothetical protein